MATTITMTSCVPRSTLEETYFTIAWTYTGSPGTLHFWNSTDGVSYSWVASAAPASSPKNTGPLTPGVKYYWKISDYADAIWSNVMSSRLWKIGELQVKNGASWVPVTTMEVNLSGVWTDVSVAWVNVGGTWQVSWCKGG